MTVPCTIAPTGAADGKMQSKGICCKSDYYVPMSQGRSLVSRRRRKTWHKKKAADKCALSDKVCHLDGHGNLLLSWKYGCGSRNTCLGHRKPSVEYGEMDVIQAD